MTQRVHAFGDDALGHHDAVGLAEEIRAGRVSATEVVEAAIARVEQVDPEVAAVEVRDYDRARSRAAGGTEGFFAGVPTFIKDNADVAGLPTQQGTRAFRARPAKADGDFAKAFFSTGVINLGKTRLSEFGFSASAEPPGDRAVRTPWDTDYTAGASSSGAAALVAAGAVPFAHANDGGGSIRIPAAVNGLVGMKATRGRVPQDKMMREMPVRIIGDGVVTRSVRDTAAFLREIEKYERALNLPPIGDVTGPAKARRKIALVVHSIAGIPTHRDVIAAARATGELLESLGHEVEEISLPVPESFLTDFLTYWSLLSTYLLSTGKKTLGPDFDRRKTDQLSRGLARHGLQNSWRIPSALTRLRRSTKYGKQLSQTYDLAVSPTLAHPTPKIGWLDPDLGFETTIDRLVKWAAFTPLQNASGDPAMSLPLGVDSNGLPLGMQLTGPHGTERVLLELAYELEEAAPFRRIDA